MTAETVTVILGDLHAGSSTAVCTPTYTENTGEGDEEKLVHANRIQEWLYTCWTTHNDYIKTLIGLRGKHRKRRLVTCFLGEFVDGNHHGSKQMVQKISDQMVIAKNLFEPLVDLSDGGFFVTPGTEAHSGENGKTDREIADSLGAVLVDWHLTLDIDGLLIDLAHHDRASQRDWTSAGARIAAEVVMDCAIRGAPVPRYAFRGHSHVIDDSGIKNPACRAICTPAWQLRTAFGYKVSSAKKRSDIGGLFLVGGVLDDSLARYKAPQDLSQYKVYRV